MTSKPPTMTLWWCEKCGQDDRFEPLRFNHIGDDGYRCTGTIRLLVYALGGVA